MSSNKNIASFDSDPKLSSSTFFTERAISCDCPRLDPDLLRLKLEEILFSLQQEIDLRNQELHLERQNFQESLREKD